MNTDTLVRRGSTLLLKVALFVMGAIVLALCIFAVPPVSRDVAAFIDMPYLKVVFMIGVYVVAVLFFFALYQAFTLLRYVDKNAAFAEQSVVALDRIAYCAIAITVVFAAGMPFMYLIAQKDDAPGLVVLGMIITCAPLVIATFAAVLKKLLKNAIDIKAENDLIV